jgi:hypothetical protein
MIVTKVRGQEKVGKILISASEAHVAKSLGLPVEKYIKLLLADIAKKRRWKWYFKQQENT